MKKIYVISIMIVICFVILGMVLYRKENDSSGNTQEIDNSLQKPIHVQLSEPNGEEKVKNIPVEIKEAGNRVGEENISVIPNQE